MKKYSIILMLIFVLSACASPSSETASDSTSDTTASESTTETATSEESDTSESDTTESESSDATEDEESSDDSSMTEESESSDDEDTSDSSSSGSAEDGTLELTLEELAQYDGQDGNLAYIAVDGIIYDVTNSRAWGNGEHNGYSAGKDLTEEINNMSPHGVQVLGNIEEVGVIVD